MTSTLRGGEGGTQMQTSSLSPVARWAVGLYVNPFLLQEYPQLKELTEDLKAEIDSNKKPFRPTCPSRLFLMEKKSDIWASNPNLTYQEVRKKAGQIWRETLDPEEKAKYIMQSKIALEEYQKKKTAYEASLGPDSPKIPRQPMSAFLLFFKDIKEEIKASNHTGSIHEKASQIWRETLDPDRKAEYIRRYKESMKEYRKEMAAYKDGLDSTR